MKGLTVVLVATLAIGCNASPTPTSPSAGLEPAMAAQDASSGRSTGFQKVTVYFWSDDDPSGGNEHLVGLPVDYTGNPNGPSGTTQTGKQGEVTLLLAKTDKSVTISTGCFVQHDPAGDELYAAAGPWTISLPYGVRENWILVHGSPAGATGCP